MERFFPEIWFGWLWLALLLSGALAAAYLDFRRYVIPKTLTIGLVVVGIIFQVVRGFWLGAQGFQVWLLPTGAFFGGVDGLLFALAGFVTGFGLFFALWLLGTCGGGDVKLFAAVATWIGPILALWLLGASILFVAVLASLKGIFLLLTGRLRETLPTDRRNPAGTSRHSHSNRELSVQEMLERGQRPKRLLSFSLPLALALALVLGWKWRQELRLLQTSSINSPAPTQRQYSP